MKLSIIAGARPNFMKIAPLIQPLKAVGGEPRIIHTGQHYDQKMSQTFFEELNIPRPDINLEVGSGSHIWQIAEVMRRLEEEFTENRPDAVVVVGDVNSTVAAAITAKKLDIPVAHVEAGLRSFDRDMPEELNRLLTDSISDWLFTSEPSGTENLQREGVPAERIHFVGNVMIDTLLEHLETARAQDAAARFQLEPRGYAVLTLHRPSNVDSPENLESILKAIHRIAAEMPVVFPVHPRTQARLEAYGFDQRDDLQGYRPIEPVGYHTILGLMDSARLVLTDSGGLQEESSALQVPCITLRQNTERPATLEAGTNRLVGWDTDAILEAYQSYLSQPERVGNVPELWDGKASERIAEVFQTWWAECGVSVA